MARFAGMAQGLGNLFRKGGFVRQALMPEGQGGGQLMDLAMSYGPDLAFAGLSAATAPGGFNLGVGAEDLGISLLGTGLGRFAGEGLSRTLLKNNPVAAGRAKQAADLLVSAPLQILAPRPVLTAAINQQIEGQQEQQQAAQEARDRKLEEQLIASLFTTGGLALGSPYQAVV